MCLVGLIGANSLQGKNKGQGFKLVLAQSMCTKFKVRFLALINMKNLTCEPARDNYWDFEETLKAFSHNFLKKESLTLNSASADWECLNRIVKTSEKQ